MDCKIEERFLRFVAGRSPGANEGIRPATPVEMTGLRRLRGRRCRPEGRRYEEKEGRRRDASGTKRAGLKIRHYTEPRSWGEISRCVAGRSRGANERKGPATPIEMTGVWRCRKRPGRNLGIYVGGQPGRGRLGDRRDQGSNSRSWVTPNKRHADSTVRRRPMALVTATRVERRGLP